MSFNYNHVTLVGRLTKDPEFFQISDDFCKLTFALAISRKFKSSKNNQDEVDFIPICLFGNMAVLGEKLLSKGMPVLVWGRLQVRVYEKDHKKNWITEVMAENFQLLKSLSVTGSNSDDKSK